MLAVLIELVKTQQNQMDSEDRRLITRLDSVRQQRHYGILVLRVKRYLLVRCDRVSAAASKTHGIIAPEKSPARSIVIFLYILDTLSKLLRS